MSPKPCLRFLGDLLTPSYLSSLFPHNRQRATTDCDRHKRLATWLIQAIPHRAHWLEQLIVGHLGPRGAIAWVFGLGSFLLFIILLEGGSVGWATLLFFIVLILVSIVTPS